MMRHYKALCVALLAMPMSVAQGKQPTDAQSLLRQCEEIRIQRLVGVTHYVVDKSMMGNRVAIPYERVEGPGPDGSVSVTFRQARRTGPASGAFSSEDLQLFGQGAEAVGSGLAREMEAAGFPPGLLGGPGQDP